LSPSRTRTRSLLGIVWLGWWWADPAAAFVIVYYGVREGRHALHEATVLAQSSLH
jgi:divalent metal cation (Fe/Co/Zn/Cd) transporter